AEYLGHRGFTVETAADGEEGLVRLKRGGIDLVGLDVMLPGKDGLEIMKEVRGFSRVPVVMLTARGDQTDPIVGLERGDDECLRKPFNPRGLLARVQAALRRAEAPAGDASEPVLRAGTIVVDPARRLATKDGAALDLTTTEFEMLRTLVANTGRV